MDQGLEDDRRHLTLIGVQGSLNRCNVVERDHDGGVDYLGEDSLRDGVLPAEPVGRRDDVHGHRVVPTVIAALELDQVPPVGRRPGDPNGMEGGLGPRRGEQHLLHRRHQVDQAFRELDLVGGNPQPGMVEPAGCGGGRPVHIRVVVAQYRRTECRVVIGVGPARCVGEGRPAGRDDHQVFDPRELPLGAVDATRNHRPCPGRRRTGNAGHLFLVPRRRLSHQPIRSAVTRSGRRTSSSGPSRFSRAGITSTPSNSRLRIVRACDPRPIEKVMWLGR